ncbi:MAG: hypothetical protein KIS85_00200 [Anaerolineales bacterium]|nr:hypothetical protein [Anaerolineales bacterium]
MDYLKNKKNGNKIFLILCMGLIVLQFIQVGREFFPIARLIRQDIGKSGAWRAARFTHNRNTASYFQFIDSLTSGSAHILTGEDTGAHHLTRPLDLKLSLYPRDPYNCPGASYVACLQNALEQGTPALITSPGALEQVETDSRYVAYDENWGLLNPNLVPGPASTTWTDYENGLQFFAAFLPPLIFLTSLSLPGILLTVQKTPQWSAPLHIATGFGGAVAAHSFLVFLVLAMGVELSVGLILLLAVGLWVPVLRGLKTPSFERFKQWLDLPNWWPVYLFVALLTIVQLFFAAGKGYSYVDEFLLWASKGYGIEAKGLQIGASQWGTPTTRYPLNIPIHISNFLELFGDQLPESKLLFPFFHSGLMLLVAGYLSRVLPRLWTLVAVALLGGAPMLFTHATLGYANLPYAFYLIAAAFSALMSLNEKRAEVPAWVAGIFLAFGAWTRPEGLPINAVLLAGWLLFLRRFDSKALRATWLAFSLPFVLYTVVWQVFAPLVYAGPGFAQNILGGGVLALLSGRIHWMELLYVVQQSFNYIFTPSLASWGGLSAFFLLALVLSFSLRAKIARDNLVLLGGGLVFLLIMISSYYMTVYDPDTLDVSWWVTTGLSRMLMPGILLLWTASFTTAVQAILGSQATKGAA